ncbi:MAG: hypothetical protein EAX96_16775 [Candidatus Lokiarchaeota archaeon]|nr:hypothetical protein [Candidatus Lokiarchaeota archaeon]
MKVDYLLKIGGSLINHPKAFKKLMTELPGLFKRKKFVIITGGGILADKIRDLYKIYDLLDDNAHWMAIKTQDILASLINSQLDNSILVDDLSKLKNLDTHQIPILEPYNILKQNDELPHSWDVTGDAIAIFLGIKMKLTNVILVKDVDGIYEDFNDPNNPKKLKKTINIAQIKLLKSNCLDSYSLNLLKNSQIKLYLVNGFYSERIFDIFMGKDTICTRVFV